MGPQCEAVGARMDGWGACGGREWRTPSRGPQPMVVFHDPDIGPNGASSRSKHTEHPAFQTIDNPCAGTLCGSK